MVPDSVLAKSKKGDWILRGDLLPIRPQLSKCELIASSPGEGVRDSEGDAPRLRCWALSGERPVELEEDALDRVLGFGPRRSGRAAPKGTKLEAEEVRDLCRALQWRELGVTLVAAVLGQGLHQAHLCPRVDVEVLRQNGFEDERHASDQYLKASACRKLTDVRELTLLLHRSAMHRGSDIRLATGALMRPDAYPRLVFDASRLEWRTVCAYGRCDEHINALELAAVVASVRWRARQGQEFGRRHINLADSQVAQSVMTRGRTTSTRLRYLLRRLNALVLAMDALPGYAYVHTAANPADAPSRWQRGEQ
jgi:hypothetical protein